MTFVQFLIEALVGSRCYRVNEAVYIDPDRAEVLISRGHCKRTPETFYHVPPKVGGYGPVK